MIEKYKTFIELLNLSKKEGHIKILHRGTSKGFAFRRFSLDPEINNMNQFGEKLFFFGEKSRYFWNNRVIKFNGYFAINDISDVFFKNIFFEFDRLLDSSKKDGTKRYFKKNKKTSLFFGETNNSNEFIEVINKLNPNEKLLSRNYYLRILHQLGESEYKKESEFISSSKDRVTAEKFSKKDKLLINFWDLNFLRPRSIPDIPKFIGKPYKNQKEISVFGAILPHFIYSFEYRGDIYVNPAIDTTPNLKEAIFSGLKIKQENFMVKLSKETRYKFGLQTDGINYKKLGNSEIEKNNYK